jgi:prepilin-type N-terminal cleavage/methylation domain-containing protein
MYVLSTARTVRRGFTLVEMLVVIAIIGILAGLISAAAVIAIRKANVTRIVTEFSQIELALTEYKKKYGEYPPDGTDFGTNVDPVTRIPVSFQRHFSRVFPNADLPTELSLLATNYGYACGNPSQMQAFFSNYTPATALVFWLGGMQEANYSNTPTKNAQSRFVGFSADRVHPLSNNGSSREPVWFEFDVTRISDPSGATVSNTIFRRYLGNSSVPEPYVYFRAELNQRTWEYTTRVVGTPVPVVKQYPPNTTSDRTVKAYFDSTQSTATMPGAWVHPTSYQLLFCGFDNTFGTGNWYPTGKMLAVPRLPGPPSPYQARFLFFDYVAANDDDITNFAGGTVGDKKP